MKHGCKRMPVMLSLALCPMLLLPLNDALALRRSGVLYRSERWHPADSPIRVVGELRIPRGVSVTINPGVVVELLPTKGKPGRIVVDGELRAIGTALQPIVFRSTIDIQGTDNRSYEGIIISPTATPANLEGTKGCAFKYCVFTNGRHPLVAKRTPVYIGYCWFENVGVTDALDFAISLDAGVIEYSRIRRCGTGALFLGKDAIARGCLIEDGMRDAIGGNAYIENCTIRKFPRFALSERGESFFLFSCLVNQCGTLVALPNADGAFPNVTLEDTTVSNIGADTGWGVIHIRNRSKTNKRRVTINARGSENRILSPVLISDAIGGHEIIVQHIWWGTSNPDTKDANRFHGVGTKFTIFPVAPTDPYLQRISHEGAVVDADNKPVSDAMVWIADSRTAPTTTDAEGRFHIRGSTPGVYTLYAYMPYVGLGKAVADWAFAGEVSRTMGAGKEPLLIRLPGTIASIKRGR